MGDLNYLQQRKNTGIEAEDWIESNPQWLDLTDKGKHMAWTRRVLDGFIKLKPPKNAKCDTWLPSLPSASESG